MSPSKARSDSEASSCRAVLLGAEGMLARSWRGCHRHTPIPGGLRSFSRKECDITSETDVARAITPGVTLVINTAAYTDVDGAETDEVTATEINGCAVGRLADHCRTVGATLVTYSTDYVFSGRARAPYPTDHPREPINAYGRSKSAGEEMLEHSSSDFLLIRTSWLYAPHGNNFVRTIARLSRKKPSLRVVDDQFGRPTSADQLVAITLRLLRAGARGFHHASDDGECSWFEFAQAIAARSNPACRIEPCASDVYPRPAQRPSYSVLDLSKTIAAAGPIAHWRDALADVLGRLDSPEEE